MTGIAIAGIGVAPNATSYVSSAAQALRDAMTAAGVSGEQVGVLISTGAARDLNISEPAVAALIQQETGIHMALATSAADPSMTTFDLLNGGLGFGTALSLIADMVSLGEIEYGALIAGDVHPSMNPFYKPVFPLASDVYAVIVGKSDQATILSTPPHPVSDDLASEVYIDVNDAGAAGRSHIGIDLKEYDEAYFRGIAAAIDDLDPGDRIDEFVLVAPWRSEANATFYELLGHERLRVLNYRTENSHKPHYTAAQVAALDYARKIGTADAFAVILAPTVPGPEVAVIASYTGADIASRTATFA